MRSSEEARLAASCPDSLGRCNIFCKCQWSFDSHGDFTYFKRSIWLDVGWQLKALLEGLVLFVDVESDQASFEPQNLI